MIDEAAKYTNEVIKKPIHRNRFSGSPRKLKGKSRGRWVKVGEGRWKYVRP